MLEDSGTLNWEGIGKNDKSHLAGIRALKNSRKGSGTTYYFCGR